MGEPVDNFLTSSLVWAFVAGVTLALGNSLLRSRAIGALLSRLRKLTLCKIGWHSWDGGWKSGLEAKDKFADVHGQSSTLGQDPSIQASRQFRFCADCAEYAEGASPNMFS